MHSTLFGKILVLLSGVTCDGNNHRESVRRGVDLCLLVLLILLFLVGKYLLGGFKPVHYRHVTVHKNQLYCIFFLIVSFYELHVFLKSLFSVVGFNYIMLGDLVDLLKDIFQYVNVEEDVVYNHDSRA